MDCKICFKKFNREDKRPRYIPCGHTFCSCCLEELLEGSLTCPMCRSEHKASDITQFPIAHLVEELIEDCSVMKPEKPAVTTSNKPLQTSSYDGKVISKKLASLREEQKDGLKSVEDTCRSMSEELTKYTATLSRWDSEHKALLDRITRHMIKRNEEARRVVADEKNFLQELQGAGDEHRSRLEVAKEALSTAETAQQVVSAIGKADQCQVEAEDWFQKCRDKLPNIESAYKSVKVRMLIEKALEIMYGETHDDLYVPLSVGARMTDGGYIPMYLADTEYTIGTRINYVNEFARMKFMAENLRKPDRYLADLLKANLVYTTKFCNDQRLFAKVSKKFGKLYLHGLTEDAPPEQALILQHDAVLKLMNECNTMTFLDIALPDSPAKRVFIRLNPVSVRGRHYILLCTGQLGPCYTGSILRKVVSEGEPGEFIVAGRLSCAGGPPSLPFDRRLNRTASAGCVFGLPEQVTKGAQGFGLFCVCTRTMANTEFTTTFGRVEEGIEVFAAAAKVDNIGSVKVVDCGVMLE